MTEPYVNIREILGRFIGKRLEDITQHDREHFEETGESFVMLMFEGGDYIKFPVGDDGFEYSQDDEEEDAA